MSGDDPACIWLRGSSNPPARTLLDTLACTSRVRTDIPVGAHLSCGSVLNPAALRSARPEWPSWPVPNAGGGPMPAGPGQR